MGNVFMVGMQRNGNKLAQCVHQNQFLEGGHGGGRAKTLLLARHVVLQLGEITKMAPGSHWALVHMHGHVSGHSRGRETQNQSPAPLSMFSVPH